MAHDVFLSYSSQDKGIADAACAKLEQAQIRCWIAPRDVTPGSGYAGEIVSGINNSRLVVLVLSNNSNASKHVLREVERAVSKGLPILPFRIEPVELTQNLEYFLSSSHWLDALTPPIEKHLNHLVETVQMLLARLSDRPATANGGTAPRPSIPQQPQPQKRALRWDRRIAWSVAGLSIALLAAGIYFGFPWLWPQPAGGAKTVHRPSEQVDSNSTTDSTAETPAAVKPAEPEPDQVIDGDRFRDNDFAIELRRPSADWEFMTEEATVKIKPDAFLGMSNYKNRCQLLMIAEPQSQASLFSYMDAQLDLLTLADRTESGPDPIELDGQSGLKAIVTGKVQQSLQFTYYLCVVQRDDWFYQIVGWVPGNELGPAEAELDAIVDSLKFLTERQPVYRMPKLPSSVQHGIDWQIVDDKYSNVSFDFQLAPQPGWRFAGATERQQLNPLADVVLMCQQPPILQLCAIERIGTAAMPAALNGYREQFEAEITNKSPDQTAAIRCGEMSGERFVYHDVDDPSGKVDYSLALICTADQAACLKVQASWQSSDREQALAKLGECQGSISRISRHESALLKQRLKDVDADNAVGSTYSLRGGVFQDFEHGFVFRRPQDGLWRMQPGIEAKLVNPLATLYCKCPQWGIEMAIIPELLSDVSHQEYHRQLAEAQGSVATPQTLALGDLELLISAINQSFGPLVNSTRLITAVRDERHVQILVSGLEQNLVDVDAKLPMILAGFEIPEIPLVPIAVDQTRVRDYRFGYQLAANAPGFDVEVEKLPFGFEAVASMAIASGPMGACMVMAICDVDVDEDRAVTALLESSGLSEFNLHDQAKTNDSLGGLPATRIDSVGRREGQRVAFTVCTIRRGNTAYFLVAIRQRGDSVEADERQLLDTYFNFFSLLPDRTNSNNSN